MKIIFPNILHFLEEMALILDFKQMQVHSTILFLHHLILTIYENLFDSTDQERASILKLPFNEEFCQRNELLNTDFLFKYFPTIGDIFDVTYLISIQSKTSSAFRQIALSVSLLIQVQDVLKVVTLSLINCLRSLLEKSDFDGSSLHLSIPSSYFLCTTSHLQEPVPIFGMRRLDKSTKIIAGSPGMSAFIQEVFLFPHPN